MIKYLTTDEKDILHDSLVFYEKYLENLIAKENDKELTKPIENSLGLARVLRHFAQNKRCDFHITES